MKSKLLLASVSTLVAVLLCELILWLAGGPTYPAPLYPGDIDPIRDETFDPLVGWKLPPDTLIPEVTGEYSVSYRSNLRGFRSRPPRPDLNPDEPDRRIVLLGDSYTFGSGVADDETFAAVLETKIEGTRCDNFGIGAYGIDQMWLTLRHYAMPLKPDVVILSFIRNDLDRGLSSYRRDHVWRWKPAFRLSGGELAPMTSANRPGALRRFLHQRSGLFRLWLKTEHSLSRRYAIGYRWRLNRAIFEAIRDDCRRLGVPLVVVHIPVNRRKPTPIFEREFADMGIDYLDLGPLLPADADALYYPRDRHFNAGGHRFAAEAIYRFLVERNLVE